ncbi:MAG: hypothetical protein HY318_05500 [Armatimonadetes bacterium]|nr:hypothetical protein [Armatimonadota bacterium]
MKKPPGRTVWEVLLGFAVVVVYGGASAAKADRLEIRPSASLVVQAQDDAPVAFLLYNGDKVSHAETLSLICNVGEVKPTSLPFSLQPREWKIVTARVSLKESVDAGELVCRAGTATARITVLRGIDLTSIPWKRKWTDRSAPADPRGASNETEDSNWPEIHAPSLWNENEYAWCRVHITVPATWRGHKVRFVAGAIDDNDVTYLNGEVIGRTNGWDILRDYTLPERLIRWGEDNVLTVMVDNPNYGGGLYKGPYLVLAGETPLPPPQAASSQPSARPAPGNVGKPLPLRRFHVAEGVLRYPEGTEVALWGVNYYPQSWHQFENLRRLGLDADAMKKVILEDLDHLQKMGVEVLRIHVFDREISDGEGNLVPNVHLDLLDYLVSECSRRGTYMFFTPIAWWAGPNERKGAFSAETSKPGMMFVPSGKAAAARYLKQFLGHVNRYSGKAYKEEPCLCLLEVQNEPTYFLYGDLYGSGYTSQGERPEVIERDRQTFLDLWQKWLADHSLQDSSVYFPLFRYELMRQYAREMVEAIRSTGATQPIALSSFGANGDDLTQALADSECEAITVSAYPGGWERVNDGFNLLPHVPPLTVDARLSGKARLAYEFDTPATNTSCYLFPALAASFRSGEVQVACQFQYDSARTARWNTDWNAHWLNWLFTPSKTVSFLIGGATFRNLPRGIRYTTGKEELLLGSMATSFPRNLSLFVTPDTVMHSRTLGDWNPIALPKSPRLIVGVGSSPYIDYGGTGLYVLRAEGKSSLRLTLNPDSRLVGNCLLGSLSAPVAELENNLHCFRLKLPGWTRARCWRLEGKKEITVSLVRGGWLLTPGEYIFRK